MNHENEQKSFDVFCKECNVQTAAQVAATHTKVTPADPAKAKADPTDAQYYVSQFELAFCNRCESVFLKQVDFIEIPGEVCAPQEERILYPSNREVSIAGMPHSTARAYLAAARSFEVGLYEPCVIMCRKTIESLCKELGATKGNLKDRLYDLQKRGQIDKKLMGWADELRLIGNDAAHDLDIVIEQADAQDALEFVEAIISYAFLLTRKFEEFKKRRSQSVT